MPGPSVLLQPIQRGLTMNFRKTLHTCLWVMLAWSPATVKGDAVLEWNEILVAMVKDQPPTLMNRVAAITHLAVFEAVNAVTGDYKPYLGTVTPSPGVSAEAAAIAAAHTVLKNYFPNHAATLDAARARTLASIPEGPAKTGGIALGEVAATLMIAARANDGSAQPESYLPASSKPGEWQLTPDCPASGGVFLHWRKVTPFALRSADQFRSDPPPALESARYTRDYNEVKAVGAAEGAYRPKDRADVVHLYAAVGDAILWNPVARQVAVLKNSSLSENARAFALLNVALSDAAVAVLETKYHYILWRPETAIRAGGTDGNPKTDADASYRPFISTPCFPSYPSGHATSSYAAREVLERLYGVKGHSITVSSPAVPGVSLKYADFKTITTDIDDARVYGGIHFRFDQEGGAEQGRRIGRYVYRHSLGPVRSCACEDDEEAGESRRQQ
jgi:hypothetical protein